MKRLLMFAVSLLLAVPLAAFAASGNADALNLEYSMVVTGTIAVHPDGRVAAYELDDADKLPDSVRKLAGQAIPHWQFEPVQLDGQAVLARTGMSIRFQARQVDEQHVELSIAGANFGCSAKRDDADAAVCPDGSFVTAKQRHPPEYPSSVLFAHIQGTVILTLEVGKDGHVQKAAAKQVNLRTRVTGRQAKRARKSLADASLDAARRWRFNVPTVGPKADRTHWFIQIPITYNISNIGRHPSVPGYGQWDVYIPGPIHRVAWSETDATSPSGAAVAGDGPFLADSRFVLKTPLGGTADAGSS